MNDPKEILNEQINKRFVNQKYLNELDAFKTYDPATEGKGKAFLHVIETDGKWDVVTSVHAEPNLGGQQLKGGFTNRKAAENFAKQRLKSPTFKGDKLMFWKRVGDWPKVNWVKA